MGEDKDKKGSPEEQNDEGEKPDKEDEGVAGGILKGIGKAIPGLGGLIESVGKSPAFKERLKEVDNLLERKIKETPLKRTEGRASGIPGGIPPGVRGSAVGRKHKPAPTPSPPPEPQEKPADIFDEEDHIKVIAEIPGVAEKDIEVGLEKDSLTISADTPDRKYHQKLQLPCEPKGKLKKTYRNGILEIRIQKTDEG